METFKITIQEIKQVKGFIHQNSYYNYAGKYNSSVVLSHSYEPVALYVKGINEKGELIDFYTPTIIFNKRRGLLNFETCENNSWIKIEDGESLAHKGAAMFDGGKYPNVAFQTIQKRVILINEGETYTIKANIKSVFKGTKRFNRVKLVA